MKRAIINIVIACFLVASAAAVAAANDKMAPSGDQQKTSGNGVAYLSGGVGKDARTQMDLSDDRYNLKLIFDYQADDDSSLVNVKIQDEKGKVLIDTNAKGPWFFAKLPAGFYQVTTNFNEHVEIRNITIGPHTRSLIEDWNLY